MLLAFPLFALSLTWAELEFVSSSKLCFEQTNITESTDLPAHDPKSRKLYLKQRISTAVSDKVSFVGIADCTFDSISNIEGGVVSLINSQTIISNTEFSNIEKSSAICLFACHMSEIIDCTFSDLVDSVGISLNLCNDIKLDKCTFDGFESSFINSSTLIIRKSKFVLVNSSVFEQNNLTASVAVVSNSMNITFNNVTFRENNIIVPGCLFATTTTHLEIQNSQFLSNNCQTHSCALLTVFCQVFLAWNLFDSNMIVPQVGPIPPCVVDLPVYQVANAVTVFPPTFIVPEKNPTVFKNLFFNNNSPLLDTYFEGYFIQSIDLYYDGNHPTVIGKIQCTGDDFFQVSYIGSADFSQYQFGVKELNWNSSCVEPLSYSVNYAFQPFLPSLTNQYLSRWSNEPPFVVKGDYPMVTIAGCEFDNSHIFISKTDNSASLIYMNLNDKGFVSISNTSFTKNQIGSSVIDVVKAKGLSITNCSFSHNVARFSSGALIVGVPTVRIAHCDFTRNNAYTHGCLAIYNSTDTVLVNCLFRKNSGFMGPSCLVVENTNIVANGTDFQRNAIDFLRTTLPKGAIKYEQNETMSEHSHIKGVAFHKNIAGTFSAYGKSNLSLSNVVFSDNDLEDDIDAPINLTGVDGYADDEVIITVHTACTDNKRFNFNRDWKVKYDARKCDLNETYLHSESFVPIPYNVSKYFVYGNPGGQTFVEGTTEGIVYDAQSITHIELSTFINTPIIVPTFGPINPQNGGDTSLAAYKKAIISVAVVCTIVLVVGVALIYKYRRKPENRLKKNTPEAKERMDGLMGTEESSPYHEATEKVEKNQNNENDEEDAPLSV